MQNTMNTKNSITINAPAAKVWDALTKPEMIKQWFFGVDTKTDWKVGSPIVHTGEYQGKPYEDKGKIVKFEPKRVLEHSHWSSMSGLPDKPENYQDVTYSLSERGSGTELTITEVNLPNEQAKAVSEKSWKGVLDSLKKLLEK